MKKRLFLVFIFLLFNGVIFSYAETTFEPTLNAIIKAPPGEQIVRTILSPNEKEVIVITANNLETEKAYINSIIEISELVFKKKYTPTKEDYEASKAQEYSSNEVVNHYLNYYDINSKQFYKRLSIGQVEGKDIEISENLKYYAIYKGDKETGKLKLQLYSLTNNSLMKEFELGDYYPESGGGHGRMQFTKDSNKLVYKSYSHYIKGFRGHYINNFDCLFIYDIEKDDTKKYCFSDTSKNLPEMNITEYWLVPDSKRIILEVANLENHSKKIMFDMIEGKEIFTIKDYYYDDKKEFNLSSNTMAVYGSETPKLLSMATGEPICSLDGPQLESGFYGAIKDVAILPDSKNFIITYGDKTIRIWDPVNGKILKTVEPNSINGHIYLTDNSDIIISTGRDKYNYEIYNIKTGQFLGGILDDRFQIILNYKQNNRYAITYMSYNVENRYRSKLEEVYLWDMANFYK